MVAIFTEPFLLSPRSPPNHKKASYGPELYSIW